MIAFTMLVVTMHPLIFKTSLISVIEAYVGTYPTSMMDLRVVNYSARQIHHCCLMGF